MVAKRPIQGTGSRQRAACGAGPARAASPMPRSQRGFSLMEVLAALILLGLLLIGVYAGIRTGLHSVRSGQAAVERLDQIRSAQQLLQRELAQSLAVPIAQNAQGDNLYFLGENREMRYVAALPGYLGANYGPQLQVLRLANNGKGALRLEMSFAVIPPDGSKPKALSEPEVLVDGITGGSFEYRGRDFEGKPGNWQPQWSDGRLMPSLVRVALTLDSGRAWPTLQVPLRVDPSAAQGPLDLLRGLRGAGQQVPGAVGR